VAFSFGVGPVVGSFMQIAGTWLARDQDDLAGFVDLDPGYIQTSRDRGFYRGGYVALAEGGGPMRQCFTPQP